MRTIKEIEQDILNHEKRYKDAFKSCDFHYCGILKLEIRILKKELLIAEQEETIISMLDELVESYLHHH